MLKRTITGIGIVIVTVGFFLCKYFLTSAVLVGVSLKPITVGDLLFDLFILVMAVISTYEYERAFSDKLLKSQRAVIFIYPFAVYIAYCVKGMGWAFGTMIFLFLILLSLLVFEYEHVTLESIGISLFVMIYPATILVSLLVINRYKTPEPLLMAFAITPCADTFAYFVGNAMKGKKLCPNISPNKTVSGFIGGLVGGMIASLLVYFIFTEKGLIFGIDAIWLEAILFAFSGVACALLTSFGDLVESVIKRKLGIKDMGKLLPGHGGMSDRIDGLTFTAPVVAFVFTILIPIFNSGSLIA